MDDVTAPAPETTSVPISPQADQNPTDNKDASSSTAGQSTISSQPPVTNDDNLSPPPPDEPSPPPPESTPVSEPPPPPPDSSPPPPPSPTQSSPPPPKQSSSPPTTFSPPPPDATVSSPPPPDDSQPPPVSTPETDSPPPQPKTTPTPVQTPPSTIPDTNSPSPPSPPHSTANDKTTPSPGLPRSSRSGGGTPGKGSTSSEKPSPASSSTNNNTGLIVALAVISAIALALVIIGVICCCRKKKKKQMYIAPGGGHIHGKPRPSSKNKPADHVVKLPPPPGGGIGNSGEYSFGYGGAQNPGMPLSPNMGLGVNTCSFTYQDLAAATGGFSEANVIGQGGFGFVYKGVLPNGKEVAVKSLKAGSGQGEREFQAEVEIISRVHHRYLVSLVGYCTANGQRMLVYDFVPNRTLEYHLHGTGQPTMDWGTRLKIATGSAKGLAYLHEDCHPRIIHRDIKAANILIDYNFEAQVADFGLAKLSVDNNTHVSTRVMGTFGYLAPEYASSGKLSEKSDVFSFGVMLLELITGRKPLDHTGKMEDSLVDWARPHLTKAQEDKDYKEIADPRLENNYDHNEMARMVACASTSIRHSARRRPKMSQIVRALEGDLSFEALNDTKSGQGMTNGNDSSMYNTGEYNADMMKFRKMVMSNDDFTSSEYGDSSEYGYGNHP